jgi:hypothetical protein
MWVRGSYEVGGSERESVKRSSCHHKVHIPVGSSLGIDIGDCCLDFLEI